MNEPFSVGPIGFAIAGKIHRVHVGSHVINCHSVNKVPRSRPATAREIANAAPTSFCRRCFGDTFTDEAQRAARAAIAKATGR